MYAKILGVDVKVHPCQYIKNHDRILAGTEDEDDDFEEDDEDSSGLTFKVSNVAKLLCSMVPTANEHLIARRDVLAQLFFGKIEEFTSSVSRLNTYYHFDEMKDSFVLLCSGIELRQPTAHFEDNKLTFKTSLVKNPMRMDEYCDNKW